MLDTVCVVEWTQLYIATLTITSDAPGSPLVGTLRCDATGPHIDFTPRSLTFPTTRVGYWSPRQTVQVRGTDNGVVPYFPVPSPSFRSPLDNRDCNEVACFAGADPFQVSISFAPRASGEMHEQLGFRNARGTVGIQLFGTAIGPVVTVEAPASSHAGVPGVDFGHQTLGRATPPQTVRIRNNGNEPLHISSLFIDLFSEHEAFSIVSGPTGPLDVAPNATVEWQLICRPVAQLNRGALYIENNSGIPETRIALDCGGDLGRLEFGRIVELPPTALGSESTAALALRNTGNLPVEISAVASNDLQFTASPQASSLPVTVAPGETASFDVRFAPARGGSHRATLTFANDGLPFEVLADGLGLSGRADLDPAAPAFGNVRVGTTAQLPVKLSNNSERTIAVTSVAVGDPATFTIPDSLVGVSLQTGVPHSFVIQATPGASGPAETTIAFTFDHGPATIAHVTVNGAAPVLAVETWDGAPIDGVFDFGRVRVRSTHLGLISMSNTGTAPLRVASCALVGDAAFRLPGPCAVDLAPAESADLEIEFDPAAGGRYAATLHFTGEAGERMLDVPVTGVATPLGCTVGGGAGGLALILFVPVAIRRRWRRRARHASQARMLASAVTLMVLVGCSAGGPDEVIVQRRGAVTVTRTGTGEGTVSSLTRAISCGTRCTATIDGAIHLAAVASPPSTFTGWEGACAGRGTCVVRESDPAAEVIARFDRHVGLTITGEAGASPFGGEVVVNGVRCALPCVRDLAAGTTVTLDVFTPSTFTGWTGGCTPAATTCTLEVTADTHLTAHFATPNVQWIAVNDSFVPSYATAVGDEPAVAGADGNDAVVTRYSSTGAHRWTTRVPVGVNAEVFGLDHNAAGHIYVLANTRAEVHGRGTMLLQKLDATGQPLWSSSLPDVAPIYNFNPQRPGPDGLAVAPSGDVLVLTQSFLRAYRDDGSVHWTYSFLTDRNRLDVSVGGDGIAYVASQTDSPSSLIERIDTDGQNLGAYGLPGLFDDPISQRSVMAFLVVGNQLICQSGHTQSALTKVHGLDAETGDMTWLLEGMDTAFDGPLALALDGHGAMIALDRRSAVRKLVGRTILWRRIASHFMSPGGALDGTAGHDVAGDSRGRAIEVGPWARCLTGRSCDGTERVSGFVRVYDP